MRISVTRVPVDDQDRALRFYVDILGFKEKLDVPMGKYRWLTVVSPEEPNGVQLLLEPDAHPAVGLYKAALKADGIPYTSFSVADIHAEHARLAAAGVAFTQPPVTRGPVTSAVFDDSCGNLIQIVELS